MTEATRTVEGTKGNGHGPDAGGDDDPLQKRVAEGPRGGARTWYDVLEVAPDVSAADLKKAYDRALALVEGRSIGGYLMLDPLAAESARADVEAAYSVLGDVDRRRAYDAMLRDNGEEPVSRVAPARSETKSDEHAKGDDEARHARELLAIEAAQNPSPARAVTPASQISSPGLRFTAPAEPSEEAPVSPGRPSSGLGSLPSPGVRLTAPVASADPFEPIPTRRIFVAEPVEDAMSATATIPPEAAMPAPSSSSGSSGVAAPAGASAPSAAASVPAPPSGGLPETGEISGALVRELREARGLSLDDLASATKIRKPYLRAIEEEDGPNLPARVYLRGFLTQIARLLRVDRTRLAEGYLITAERVTKGVPTNS